MVSRFMPAIGAVTGKRLQWSHVFSDMVRAAAWRLSGTGSLPLQWSHVFSDMVSLFKKVE